MLDKKKYKKKRSCKPKFIGAAAAATAIGAGIFATRIRNMKKEDTELWDDVAGVYGLKSAINRKTYNKLRELIKEDIEDDMKVLEIATATGDIARDLADSCGYIIASDFSEAMIKKAKSKGTPQNLMWDIQDAACLTYPDESFNAVIIVDALHAVQYPEEILDQAKRVLKKDGILIAPNHIAMGGLAESVKGGTKEFFGFDTYNEWNYEEYIDFIASNGWNILKEEFIAGSVSMAYVMAEKS